MISELSVNVTQINKSSVHNTYNISVFLHVSQHVHIFHFYHFILNFVTIKYILLLRNMCCLDFTQGYYDIVQTPFQIRYSVFTTSHPRNSYQESVTYFQVKFKYFLSILNFKSKHPCFWF